MLVKHFFLIPRINLGSPMSRREIQNLKKMKTYHQSYFEGSTGCPIGN